MVALFIVIIVSYLIGSTPTSIIVSRLVFKSDIREHGSKNAGATNVFRTFGWKPALFVALVDIFKGWLPAWYGPDIACSREGMPRCSLPRSP